MAGPMNGPGIVRTSFATTVFTTASATGAAASATTTTVAGPAGTSLRRRIRSIALGGARLRRLGRFAGLLGPILFRVLTIIV